MFSNKAQTAFVFLLLAALTISCNRHSPFSFQQESDTSPLRNSLINANKQEPKIRKWRTILKSKSPDAYLIALTNGLYQYIQFDTTPMTDRPDLRPYTEEVCPELVESASRLSTGIFNDPSGPYACDHYVWTDNSEIAILSLKKMNRSATEIESYWSLEEPAYIGLKLVYKQGDQIQNLKILEGGKNYPNTDFPWASILIVEILPDRDRIFIRFYDHGVMTTLVYDVGPSIPLAYVTTVPAVPY